MMITNDDPTRAGIFRIPTPEAIAGFDDDQLERAADRAAGERSGRFEQFALARWTAVFTGVGACIAVLAALSVVPPITGNLALAVATVTLVLVFVAAIVVAIVRWNEVTAWVVAEDRIATGIHHRRGDRERATSLSLWLFTIRDRSPDSTRSRLTEHGAV